MTMFIYLTGAIIMFVFAVIFDRSRVRLVRRDERYWDKNYGWIRTDERSVIANALGAYLLIAVFWPASMPVAILGVVLDYFTRP